MFTVIEVFRKYFGPFNFRPPKNKQDFFGTPTPKIKRGAKIEGSMRHIVCNFVEAICYLDNKSVNDLLFTNLTYVCLNCVVHVKNHNPINPIVVKIFFTSNFMRISRLWEPRTFWYCYNLIYYLVYCWQRKCLTYLLTFVNTLFFYKTSKLRYS